MIQRTEKKPVKAVGLLSGGLDSSIAVKVVKDLGVEVYGVYFSMPWGCCNKVKAQEAAERVGIKFIVLQLDERYLEMIRKPRFGYGSALNPCVDCRIHMFKRAGQYMRSIEADFVFTGEVLGQRPMSQMRHSMRSIEKNADLEGRLLRPLCAKLMEPTIPEEQGLIDRNQLLKLNGRGRREQIEIAEKFGFTDLPNPAGGCLLTDKHFARRMEDTLKYGYRNFRETIALQWGRHIRIDEKYKAILGRDKKENDALLHYAHSEDILLKLADVMGPTCILKGENPSEEILTLAAGLVQRFSKYKDEQPFEVEYWPIKNINKVKRLTAKIPVEKTIEGMLI